jgi:hypothetical protein
MLPFDKEFTIDINADLPVERDLTAWLGAATLADTVQWVVEKPDLLETHDPAIVNGDKVARVWIRAKGIAGNSRVRCLFEASDGRKDARTFDVTITAR